MSNENDKEYTVLVSLPHTCNDEDWGEECVACMNEAEKERAIDVE